MLEDYQSYFIEGIEALLQARLSDERRAHSAACAAHRGKYLPAYDSYPHREEDGMPLLMPRSEEAYVKAAEAWDALQPGSMPQIPYLAETLEKRLEALRRFRDDLISKGLPEAVWLTKDESLDLRQAFFSGELEDLCIATAPLDEAASREDFVASSRDIASLKALRRFFTERREIDDPSLLAAIVTTARLDPRVEPLLSLAREDGLIFRLAESDKSAPVGDYVSSAFLLGNIIYLIDADLTNVGQKAVALIHELRHHFHKTALGPLFDSFLLPVDYLTRTRVLEADALAFDLSSAFILKQNGVAVGSEDGAFMETFEWFHQLGVDDLRLRPDEALNHAVSACFSTFACGLPAYEQEWVSLYPEAAGSADLGEQIARSRFLQPGVLQKIMKIGDRPYLHPAHVEFLQEQLLKLPTLEAMRPLTTRPTPSTFAL